LIVSEEAAAPPTPTDAPAPAVTPAPAAPPAPPASIGERLRRGRERLAFTVPAVAEKLHLDPKVVESLESNRFAEIGASVYVRGHLRRYAEFVGESANELVGMYSAREARPPPPDLTQIPQPERRSDPRNLVTPLVGVGAAALLAFAIWWVLAGPKSGADNTSASQTATEDAAATAAAPTPAPAPEMSLPQPQPMAATPTSAAPAPVASAATPALDAAKREEPAPRTARLRLELGGDSWIEVYDANGERLFYDVASAGSVQSVEGRAPLRVVLGNSADVRVEVNGERREIPESAADGEGARFIVNRSGSLSRAR
jgi:cytoskeleton protein RodZ